MRVACRTGRACRQGRVVHKGTPPSPRSVCAPPAVKMAESPSRGTTTCASLSRSQAFKIPPRVRWTDFCRNRPRLVHFDRSLVDIGQHWADLAEIDQRTEIDEFDQTWSELGQMFDGLQSAPCVIRETLDRSRQSSATLGRCFVSPMSMETKVGHIEMVS